MTVKEAEALVPGDFIYVNNWKFGRTKAIFKSFCLSSLNIHATIDDVNKCFYISEVVGDRYAKPKMPPKEKKVIEVDKFLIHKAGIETISKT